MLSRVRTYHMTPTLGEQKQNFTSARVHQALQISCAQSTPSNDRVV